MDYYEYRDHRNLGIEKYKTLILRRDQLMYKQRLMDAWLKKLDEALDDLVNGDHKDGNEVTTEHLISTTEFLQQHYEMLIHEPSIARNERYWRRRFLEVRSMPTVP